MKKFSEFSPHADNPFIDQLIIIGGNRYIQVVYPDKVLRDTKSGAEQQLMIATRSAVDKEAFTKIYQENIRRIIGLNNTAYKMFMFTCARLSPNNGVVELTIAQAMEYCKFKSRKSFYDGVIELLEKDVLAKSSQEDYYFVNPSIFFNGNRLQISTEYIKTPA